MQSSSLVTPKIKMVAGTEKTPMEKETAAAVAVAESESQNRARLAILELANMISVPMSLNAIVRLNVADAIWQGGSNDPLSASEILTRVVPSGGDSDNLERILRMLTSYSVFEEHLSPNSSVRRYSLTDVGKTLVTDSDGLSYASYVLQHHQVRVCCVFQISVITDYRSISISFLFLSFDRF